MFAHAQGPSSTRKLWKRIVELNIHKPIKFPDLKHFTIVSFITPGFKNILGRQLDAHDIPFVNLAEKHSGKWTNLAKIPYFNDFIQTVKTEYVLSLDSKDVLLTDDLTSLIERFEQFKCDILCGATRHMYPPNLEDPPAGNTPWMWLNCGTILGRPKQLKDFYKIVNNQMGAVYNEYNDSEQGRIKRARAVYDSEITVDHNCEIFQTMNCVSHKYHKNILTISGICKIDNSSE